MQKLRFLELDNLIKITRTNQYSSNQKISNLSVYISSNILIYSFRLLGNQQLTSWETLLTFTEKIKIKSEIIGVVDTGLFSIISNIDSNAIIHGSRFDNNITKASHCFGIVFIEQC